MATTDEAMLTLCEAMRDKCGAGVEFELALGELVGRYRRAHDARMRDAEAARLLPQRGLGVAKELQRCHRSTVYRRVSRAAKVARQIHGATKPA